MKRLHQARFLVGAASPSQFPRFAYPEVAFVGRSNAGKSSLLNRLLGGRRGIARVSKTPGRTQQINFFLVDDSLIFADLPGYGFAKVPPAMRAQWSELLQLYLETRHQLRAALLITDIRRGLEAEEWQMISRLRALGISCLVVATKADKLGQGERVRRARELAVELGQVGVELVVSSAITGEGIPQIWQVIFRHCLDTPQKAQAQR
ncbi:MAG: ribosome biogenesis GTP-binding protein YihA/YsxC [Candidatus Binatia bacterium]|nr:ribosome biogenesis GTP-binding protein YihA/YsxC [Candidatus Binatia bacterium]